MARKNWKWYVDNDDLLGCYDRYKQAYKNWKDHWWSILEEIYNNSLYWIEKYILNPIERTLKKVIAENKEDNFCYWVRLIGESGKVIYNKIGTTKRPINIRMKEILHRQYKDGLESITSYEVLNIWNCNQKKSEGLESYLRAMLIKKYNGQNYVKNDRFLIGNIFEEPTKEEMNGWALAYLE
jgi:hypothetical protein